MPKPDWVEDHVDHVTPEDVIMEEEQGDLLPLLRRIARSKDKVAYMKRHGITPEDLLGRMPCLAARDQILTRVFIEETATELRCRIDRTRSKVIIIKK